MQHHVVIRDCRCRRRFFSAPAVAPSRSAGVPVSARFLAVSATTAVPGTGCRGSGDFESAEAHAALGHESELGVEVDRGCVVVQDVEECAFAA